MRPHSGEGGKRRPKPHQRPLPIIPRPKEKLPSAPPVADGAIGSMPWGQLPAKPPRKAER
jgi:hypothetical protein